MQTCGGVVHFCKQCIHVKKRPLQRQQMDTCWQRCSQSPECLLCTLSRARKIHARWHALDASRASLARMLGVQSSCWVVTHAKFVLQVSAAAGRQLRLCNCGREEDERGASHNVPSPRRAAAHLRCRCARTDRCKSTFEGSNARWSLLQV